MQGEAVSSRVCLYPFLLSVIACGPPLPSDVPQVSQLSTHGPSQLTTCCVKTQLYIEMTHGSLGTMDSSLAQLTLLGFSEALGTLSSYAQTL